MHATGSGTYSAKQCTLPVFAYSYVCAISLLSTSMCPGTHWTRCHSRSRARTNARISRCPRYDAFT
ncbi:hypothetical protein CYLTODRAFT_427628 [Cylindrobasidium torrendii FP15055 ss-10]|uniref:Uncharacterized protein n=1 Tax=Cylindrobasidium torrendii FP15055 ss-10 TaxID=1314674 RepID=A0A0D7ASC9_9AGAR|nr:hypothetical protein CYLTODRAFT_427628 [Cylindrobasidium torrendii FP15055 ss-10]